MKVSHCIFPHIPLFLIFLLFGFARGGALPKEEVDALKTIGKTLNKRTWNFNHDPCDSRYNGGWRNVTAVVGSEDSVTCDCSFSNGTICHVTSILLKTQDLQGSLPKEFARLTFLQELNLARNFLTGSIPPEWGALPLVNLTLSRNRLTGSIPKDIGNITSLERLVLENNRFYGALPPELGGLSNLKRLYLSSNRFTGKIPSSFAKLTKLQNFRISDNQFKGTLPEFIGSWTEIDYMVLHSSGLVGPIPLSIARLTKMKQLRISDMTGPPSPFPPLQDMSKLLMLVLRNLNLTGKLPSYLGSSATNLTFLDLSFNKFSGEIPTTYAKLKNIKNIYLMGNMLNGRIPKWMVDETGGDIIDLSYNNFSKDSTTTDCYHNSMNLFASSSKRSNSSLNALCLKNFQCPKTLDSLQINCGGDEVTINNTLFEADIDDRKQGYYDSIIGGWVSSNSGIFLEDERVPRGTTIWSNSTKLRRGTDPRLYAQARLSAISLTYYAVCLAHGRYTIRLHFAEIMFPSSMSYKSLGRRIFDIYIQGVLALKDFNIAEEAGSVGKAVVKTFPVKVKDGTLEIRLSWAGKGTVDTPVNGVYGPLISAIAIESVSDRQDRRHHGLSLTKIVWIVVAAAVAFCLFILWWGGCLRIPSKMERDLKRMDFSMKVFSLRQIKAATHNFSATNKIGEGGFGPVYKGMLSDGTAIAVKQLSEKSKQGNREFLNEIGVISALQHPHLVKLHGCCVEEDQLLLVYEYVENNSLARALFGPQSTQINLDWPTRKNICLGIARGLAYIHEELRLKILHRDIKAANILLDKNLSPKISDFGLAKLYDENESHISTTPAGTAGYMAPEYAMKGHLSHKSDVYSFGVLAMEIVYGKSNMTSRTDSTEDLYFVEWVRLLWKKNRVSEFVDARLDDYDSEEALLMVKVAVLCTSRSPANRPLMSAVVKMLEGDLIMEMDVMLQRGESEDEEAEARPVGVMEMLARIDEEFDEQSDEEGLEEISEISEISLMAWNDKGKQKVGGSSHRTWD